MQKGNYSNEKSDKSKISSTQQDALKPPSSYAAIPTTQASAQQLAESIVPLNRTSTNPSDYAPLPEPLPKNKPAADYSMLLPPRKPAFFEAPKVSSYGPILPPMDSDEEQFDSSHDKTKKSSTLDYGPILPPTPSSYAMIPTTQASAQQLAESIVPLNRTSTNPSDYVPLPEPLPKNKPAADYSMLLPPRKPGFFESPVTMSYGFLPPASSQTGSPQPAPQTEDKPTPSGYGHLPPPSPY